MDRAKMKTRRTIDKRDLVYSDLFAKDSGKDLPLANVKCVPFRFQSFCFRPRAPSKKSAESLPGETKDPSTPHVVSRTHHLGITTDTQTLYRHVSSVVISTPPLPRPSLPHHCHTAECVSPRRGIDDMLSGFLHLLVNTDVLQAKSGRGPRCGA